MRGVTGGPWLAERAWGTVREDHSAAGDAWTALSYQSARSTAYRWNEDGLAGICDKEQRLCFALSFWNQGDSVMKERAFGLTNGEGNHCEDVKDEYWYVDATPTAAWLSWRMHLPVSCYPYEDLRAENARRGREEPEYKLADTGGLDERWEVTVDYAKASPEDILTRRYGVPGPPYAKDGIGDRVVTGAPTVNHASVGTKAAYWCQLTVPVGRTQELKLRLGRPQDPQDLGPAFDEMMRRRQEDADTFQAGLLSATADTDTARIVRQAVAGLVWSRCYYGYDVATWLDGDPGQPAPPSQRRGGRNRDWRHLHAADVISMPDAWEYPWFASWDLAYQAAALAVADPAGARRQLLLLLDDRYLPPSGAIPAYEWAFSDVSAPVQAWAALEIAATMPAGIARHEFLQQVLRKLLLVFGWWVNRLDPNSQNLCQGDPVYEDLAVSFIEHFTYVATALEASGLWDEEEFLSPNGLWSLSKWHAEHPYDIPVPGLPYAPVTYEPAESRSGMYGGNSNWRGPVWVPLNLLAITGLRRLGEASRNGLKVELPSRSGQRRTPTRVAAELSHRRCSLYLPGTDGTLPATGHRQPQPRMLTVTAHQAWSFS